LKKTGRRVFAAELRENAVPISEAKLNSKDVVIIGNEGHGIDPLLSEASNGSVYIPISRNTESLNAAVAAAIFMWEIGK
jgi:TrmH family RNA methyltransferase